MEKEIRNIGSVKRSAEGSRKVEGYAAVFGLRSLDLGGFVEVIDPHAADDLLDKCDVFALLNHDINRGVLARSTRGEGSLSLSVDEHGIKYSFDAPHTALGDELLEMLTRGDIRESSFAFYVEDDKWEKQDDGIMLRTITRFASIDDVSPVYQPAYPDTEVARRGMEQAEKDGLAAYYNNLKSELYHA